LGQLGHVFWGDVSVVDVFEEVEEELRSERWKRLARQWGPWVAGVLVLALVLALSWWGWDSYQTSRANEASVAYDRGMQALGDQDVAAADAAFTEAAAATGGGYKAMALMQRAGLAVTADRIDDAVTLFDEASRASRDPLLADSAQLRAAFLLMDTKPLAEVTTRLEPLTAEGRPYRAFAQEALALARLQAGQNDAARELFVLLSLGQDVPDSLRQRAQAAIESIDSGTASALAATVRAQASVPVPASPDAASQAAAPAAPPAQ
jgi:hypothetical protein